MSEANVEIVRRMFAAFSEGDWQAAFEPAHPDIKMDTTRSPMDGLDRVYEGREEVARFWLEWLEAWGDQEIEEPEVIDAGDKVLTWSTGHQVTGRGSGIQVGIPPYGWLVTLRDGSVVQATMFMDRSEALKAAGLSE